MISYIRARVRKPAGDDGRFIPYCSVAHMLGGGYREGALPLTDRL